VSDKAFGQMFPGSIHADLEAIAKVNAVCCVLCAVCVV